MNVSLSSSSAVGEEQFGRRLAARLTAGSLDLPHDTAERLRAGRMQALAHRKVAQLRSAVPNTPMPVADAATCHLRSILSA